jgi:hypothetical protein
MCRCRSVLYNLGAVCDYHFDKIMTTRTLFTSRQAKVGPILLCLCSSFLFLQLDIGEDSWHCTPRNTVGIHMDILLAQLQNEMK